MFDLLQSMTKLKLFNGEINLNNMDNTDPILVPYCPMHYKIN